MSDFIAQCEHCDQQVSYPPELDGTNVACPHCEREFTLRNTVKSEQVFWQAAPPQDPLAPITPTAPDLNSSPPADAAASTILPVAPPASAEPAQPVATELEQPDQPSPGPTGWRNCFSQNKYLLFGVTGLVSGLIGSLISELNPVTFVPTSNMMILIHTAAWTALFTAAIAYGLFWANSIYIRRPFRLGSRLKAIFCGLISGAISGAVAQAVFSMQVEAGFFTMALVQVFCWGLMGMLLALGLTTAIPNLKARHASLGGFLGGLFGGGAFMGITYGVVIFFVKVLERSPEESEQLFQIVEVGGRTLGIGLLGMAVGLSIVLVESFFREASVEVQWGPYENTFLNLGAKPVTIGGGPNDDVYVRGLDEEYAWIEFVEGQILYVEDIEEGGTPMENGSTVEIGATTLVVHANN